MNPDEEVRTPTGRYGKAASPDGLRITPLARRLIAQNGVDLARLSADARNRGLTKISEKLVREAMEAAPLAQSGGGMAQATAEPAAVLPSSARCRRRTRRDARGFSTIRQKTADRLAENWRTIPHVFQAIEVDFTAIDTVRSRNKDAFKAATGLSLTYLPFITRAVAMVLREFPRSMPGQTGAAWSSAATSTSASPSTSLIKGLSCRC